MRYLALVNRARTASTLATSVALACAAASPPPATPPGPATARPAPRPSALPPPAPSATAPTPAPSPARLEPSASTTNADAHVEILFPFAEQRILIPKASGYTVRTKVAGWPQAAEGRGVLIALDHHRPRRVLDKAEIKLRGLVDDAVGLSAGPHWLSLAAVDERSALVRGTGGSRAPFALVRFWVGERDRSRAPAPELALFSPAGTYNGEDAARSVTIDFLAAPERLGRGGAKVRVVGPNLELERRLERWQPLTLHDAPNGDIDVEVSLLDEAGTPDATSRVARTVSVNRELADKPVK
ncbi:MAG: hypothetical protein AMXMBFR56_09600 [Polyangiaceae bacterium]